MVRPLQILALLLTLHPWLTEARASEFSGRATVTSQYIYRGLSVSDGDPAFQLGLDYAHDSGLLSFWDCLLCG